MTNPDSQPLQNGQRVLKVDVLDKDLSKLVRRVEALEQENDQLKLGVARLSERMTLFQAAQGVFTLIAATIAAVFGGNR